jgi:hypothetical protein
MPTPRKKIVKTVTVLLKGCPFCTFPPSVDHFSFGDVPMWEIRCPTEHAKTGMCKTLDEAVEIWNGRQPDTTSLRIVKVSQEDSP